MGTIPKRRETMRGAKEKKIGHRRVDETGQVTFKKVLYTIPWTLKSPDLSLFFFFSK